jgi:hypothetical protein
MSKIISISGFIASGKDTVADYLVTNYGFKRLSFASSLKDSVATIFGWDREMIDGTTKESRVWREQVDQWWSNRLNIPNLTPRYILQHWGTDLCRNHFHDEIWIASVENKIRNTKNDIVITDARFSNEVTSIKHAGGTTIRISRGTDPSWYHDAVIYNTFTYEGDRSKAKERLEEANIHASEYSSVGLAYDHYIKNDGTVDELHKKVQSIVNL